MSRLALLLHFCFFVSLLSRWLQSLVISCLKSNLFLHFCDTLCTFKRSHVQKVVTPGWLSFSPAAAPLYNIYTINYSVCIIMCTHPLISILTSPLSCFWTHVFMSSGSTVDLQVG